MIALRKLIAWLRYPKQFRNALQDRQCPVCHYTGQFIALGNPPRWEGRCPNCGSRERHRLIHLFLQYRKIDLNDGRKILHFSPEKFFSSQMADNANYHTADIVPGKARHTMDMTDLKFEDNSFDVLIANHVLEHIDNDIQALKECCRVLTSGGFAIITVPINWARQDTYENPALTGRQQRSAHYGDASHVRYYGRDFNQRLIDTGFQVECWRMPQEDEAKFGLLRDEVVWIATKP